MRPRSAAVLLLSLLAPLAAQAQSQGANLIPLASFASISADNVPAAPRGDLLFASDGNLYFSSYGGGANGGGAIARVTPSGTLTTLHSFTGRDDDGAQSYSRLVQASDGNLYGTTYIGGKDGVGTLFRISLAGEFTSLHSFDRRRDEPKLPYTGLVQAGDGHLYGTTMRGGSDDRGTVFRLTLSGTVEVIHAFANGEGQNPEGTLIVGPDGNLYGTTLIGGENDRGTIYRVTTGGTLTTLYSFPSLGAFSSTGVATNATGANPRAALTLGPDGNFHGTAYQGGTQGYGTVFRMTPAGEVTVLHSFTGPTAGGAFPLAGVSIDAAGNIYGTTEQGGYLNRGTAWRLSPAGEFTLLHGFIGSAADGNTPYATLTLVGDEIYGVTLTDALSGAGAMFRLDQGTGGVLPVRLQVSPASITVGGSTTVTW